MKIPVTNDDGIFAEGLWTPVKELKNVSQVTVVAPDRERSAIGTAVTLRPAAKNTRSRTYGARSSSLRSRGYSVRF